MIEIAEFLEREAGYAVTSMALICIGLCLVDGPIRAQAADRLITFALGVMARSMGAKRNGKEASNASANPAT